MNIILAIPLGLRLACLFVLGTALGGLINWAVYTLAWNRRPISPWSRVPAGVPRRWSDRAPVFGWLALRRENALHGPGFWVRPLGVELFSGLMLVGLYLWEVPWAAPRWMVPGPIVPGPFLRGDLTLVLHERYVSHVLLAVLMLAASLIDIDEKTIPDGITISGTLLGLALAVLWPWSLPSGGNWIINGRPQVEFLTLVSPATWPADLGGLPPAAPLAIALACWTLWCGGLLPRRWNSRHGLWTAVRVFFHRLRIESASYAIGALWLLGASAISLACWRAPQPNWVALLTALAGVAVGGGVIWIVRFVGGLTLRREAMGFGDVTLMSMIGAFVGWQPSLIIFFLAPFAGLAVGLAQWILHRENEIPFGPFLCLATLAVILDWDNMWDRTADIFALAWLLVAVLAVCMALMGLMLSVYRILRDRIAR